MYTGNVASRDISGYGVTAASGELSSLGGSPFRLGQAPSVVVAEPSGFLYVTHGGAAPGDAGFVTAYAIESATGALTPVRGGPLPVGSKPSALAITPR